MAGRSGVIDVPTSILVGESGWAAWPGPWRFRSTHSLSQLENIDVQVSLSGFHFVIRCSLLDVLPDRGLRLAGSVSWLGWVLVGLYTSEKHTAEGHIVCPRNAAAPLPQHECHFSEDGLRFYSSGRFRHTSYNEKRADVSATFTRPQVTQLPSIGEEMKLDLAEQGNCWHSVYG